MPHKHLLASLRPAARTRIAPATALLLFFSAGAGGVQAQPLAPPSPVAPPDWQACTATPGAEARLACFDGWAQRQRLQPAPASTAPATPGEPRSAAAATGVPAPSAVQAAAGGAAVASVAPTSEGCHDGRYSPLSRFWELERGSDCGSFELRGYRPISLSIVASDSVNEAPASPAPGRSATTTEDYRTTEARIQLSARIKVAQNLLTRGDPERRDSLWLGFSQQAYWQVFTGNTSRPFRTTDYEPEAMYVYPADIGLPFGWRVRHAGLGLSHQSNGRQLPGSRSWNRAYLMTGLELGDRFSLEGRIWKRIGESGTDDNPDIVSQIGRAELTGTWHPDKTNTFAATVRHSLRSEGNGSVRLEYFRAVGKGTRAGNLNDLRLHAQFFSGYGDSLLDYNRKRNVFSLGVALVDW